MSDKDGPKNACNSLETVFNNSCKFKRPFEFRLALYKLELKIDDVLVIFGSIS